MPFVVVLTIPLFCDILSRKARCRNMRKTICIISNILLSSFYISTSWMVSVAALFYFVAVGWELTSFIHVCWMLGCGIIALTPLFCILGIVLSVLRWRKGRYLRAFLVQFLPFATLALSAIFFVVPIYSANFLEFLN